MTAAELVGVWRLEALDIINADGSRRAWGRNPRGLLTYTAGGHMAVGIADDPKVGDDGLETAHIFYTGTYRIEDGVLIHDTVATFHPRFALVRRIPKLEGGVLTLRTPPQESPQFELRWRRIE